MRNISVPNTYDKAAIEENQLEAWPAPSGATNLIVQLDVKELMFEHPGTRPRTTFFVSMQAPCVSLHAVELPGTPPKRYASGTLRIEYVPDQWVVELKSLKRDLLRYRDRQLLPRLLIENLLTHLTHLLHPRWIRVSGDFDGERYQAIHSAQPGPRPPALEEQQALPGQGHIHLEYGFGTCRYPLSETPDTFHATVDYTPYLWTLPEASLEGYIQSYRERVIGHEEIAHSILMDLVLHLAPRWVRIVLQFSARGNTLCTISDEYTTPTFHAPKPPYRKIARSIIVE